MKGKNLRFEVLNGSGVGGAAKLIADKLGKAGFKVIITDNADSYDYKTSQLFVSSEFEEQSTALLDDLKKEINISSISGVLKDSTASARLIIGKDNANP